MRYFSNLSTRMKLMFSFGLIWIMLFVVIAVAFRSLNNITQSEKKLHKINFETALKLRELRSHQNFNRAAILDMLLTQDKSEQATIEQEFGERELAINNIIEELYKLNKDSLFQNRLKLLKDYIKKYRQTRNEEISLIRDGKIEEARQLGIGAGGDQFEKIRSIATELGDKALKDADYQLILDQKNANSAIILFILFGIITLLFSIFMVFVLNYTIVRPLNKITKIAEQIGKGDLNVELPFIERKDEVGILLNNFSRMTDALKAMSKAAQKIASGDLTGSVVPLSDKDILGNSFLQMLNNLQSMTKDIYDGINLLASSSSEILAATTQVASGSNETASAISETTSTVEEVRQATQLSSQKASRVLESAQQISQVTQSGQMAVEDTINGMHEIQKQMENVANTIIRLSEQGQQIGNIIASVTDIADQSNLLAVNASIEAAKAGEHGTGFAVVAQEIKSLAQQSKQATIQVRNILSDIQKTTGSVVMATEQTSKSIENGVKQSAQAGETIEKLAEGTAKSMEAATQIVASSQQQTTGMDQIGLAMDNINQASVQNTASMVQAEKAAKDLNELGLKLKKLVEQYKIN
jgi:methyl-accepting chemotaxis protein